ncbi:MAG TPA: glycosyltransferase family A protein [Nitrospirota bacterium]|nr:glycosyltransferase family A protein [Nitrospirota bacterium]
MPLVSVLLPVYNGATYLAEAIDSILNQTWQDFELIILNDGSKDKSADIILGYDDPRIRYFEHENRGLAATLNRGIGLADGKYIARQDHDDISKPERFAKQVEYLDAYPECAMVGTWADLLIQGEVRELALRHPTESAEIKVELLFANPFVHTSIMMRKGCLQDVGGYAVDPAREPPEDFELWSRLARRYEVANIPEALVLYRQVCDSLSRATNLDYWERVVTICQENILTVLGCDYNEALVRGAAYLFNGVKNSHKRPGIKELTLLMHDLAQNLETRYPEHRHKLRAQLMKIFHVMLHRLYASYFGSKIAKQLVRVHSLWLFR